MQINYYGFQTLSQSTNLHVIMHVLDPFCHSGFIFNNCHFPHPKLGNGVQHIPHLSFLDRRGKRSGAFILQFLSVIGRGLSQEPYVLSSSSLPHRQRGLLLQILRREFSGVLRRSGQGMKSNSQITHPNVGMLRENVDRV